MLCCSLQCGVGIVTNRVHIFQTNSSTGSGFRATWHGNVVGLWAALAVEPALRELRAERERRFVRKATGWRAPIFDVHEAALRDAGFRALGVIWQYMGNRVPMAMR
jgi:hypothetical protein